VLETATGRALDGARQAKSLSGWPKTDKPDAMWLAPLTEMGLRASFVPPKADHVCLRPCPAARSMAARSPASRHRDQRSAGTDGQFSSSWPKPDHPAGRLTIWYPRAAII
jgi:hypothetical protein